MFHVHGKDSVKFRNLVLESEIEKLLDQEQFNFTVFFRSDTVHLILT